MNILLVTPPLLQPNTPYPATPVLTGYLKRQGIDARQRDLSLELALKMFTPETLDMAAQAAAAHRGGGDDDPLAFFLDSIEDYKRTILPVIRFLQGKNPALAWRLAARTFLPEGPFFAAMDEEDAQTGGDGNGGAMAASFGSMGITDKARYFASLYLDDVSSFLSQALDPDFAFGRYGERLAVSLPSFTPLHNRLNRPNPSYVDRLIDQLADSLLTEGEPPEVIGITVPFPGTLYGALRIAKRIRRTAPQIKIVLGGGYVNSELRDIEDMRIFDYVHVLSYDEGCIPLTALMKGQLRPAEERDRDVPGHLLTRDGTLLPPGNGQAEMPLVPDYEGLMISDYLSVVEMPNPLHRIWTDGMWLKMQLAQGCYWHRCAFCDVALDYICRYRPGTPSDIVDAMERLVRQTGQTGFHFTDEALAPSLLAAVSKEILRRGLAVSWWGNIRFETAFTAEVAQLMADAGCIAVSGGLECANDRLLKLMNKGITLSSSLRVFQAFADAGILVHTYLMYAFPTETKNEALDALDFVRGCFAKGLVQSAFWHRFALTAHSVVAKNPAQFGITVTEPPCHPRFALNELRYVEEGAPDWDRIGKVLETALYNFMTGRGLDISARKWCRMLGA